MIHGYKNHRDYVKQFIGFQWKDPLTGAVIPLPADLDDGGWMYFDSEEVKEVEEGLGSESVIYQTANGLAVQQSRPAPRRWEFVISKMYAATDDKIQTMNSFQALGYQPSATLPGGYHAGDAGTEQWTGNVATMPACAIEFQQFNARRIGRGRGILTESEIKVVVYESQTLSVPVAGGTGSSGGGQ